MGLLLLPQFGSADAFRTAALVQANEGRNCDQCRRMGFNKVCATCDWFCNPNHPERVYWEQKKE